MIKVLGCSVCSVKSKLGGGLEPASQAKPSEGCKCAITGLYLSSLIVAGSGNQLALLLKAGVDYPYRFSSQVKEVG